MYNETVFGDLNWFMFDSENSKPLIKTFTLLSCG